MGYLFHECRSLPITLNPGTHFLHRFLRQIFSFRLAFVAVSKIPGSVPVALILGTATRIFSARAAAEDKAGSEQAGFAEQLSEPGQRQLRLGSPCCFGEGRGLFHLIIIL